MPVTDLCLTSATELARLIRQRQVSPFEVVEAFLRQIEVLNPTLNAFCTVVADEALRTARLAEQSLDAWVRGSGPPPGALHGVPVAIKDVTFTRGIRTTLGSRLYEHQVPEQDAPLVSRLKEAGAIVLGKSATPEFGWKGVTDSPLFGISRNPWDVTKTPGGSSGGSAAAVASGMTPLATGTDGAGSIRIPASFCGIFGLKPSYGRVPNYPASAAEPLAHAGPMTWTVRDAALMLDVIAGPDEHDRNSLPASGVSYLRDCDRGVRGLRVAWSRDLGFAPVEREVAEIAERAAQTFTSLGCAVDAASPDYQDPAEAVGLLFFGGIGARIVQYENWRAFVDPGLVEVVDLYSQHSAFDYARATFERNQLWDATRRFFESYDLLVTPTMPLAAFEVGKSSPDAVAGVHRPHLTWTPLTYTFNLTGQPAATAPCGFTSSGLPVGLQIVGRRHDDATVLRAAAAFEAAHPWGDRRPSLT